MVSNLPYLILLITNEANCNQSALSITLVPKPTVKTGEDIVTRTPKENTSYDLASVKAYATE